MLPNVLTYIHSGSAGQQQLYRLECSTLSCIWDVPTPLISSGAPPLLHRCFSLFPSVSSCSSQPRLKTCQICPVKQEAAFPLHEASLAVSSLPVSERVLVIPHCVVATIWLPCCLSPCFLDYLMVQLPSPSAGCLHVPPDSLFSLTFLVQKHLL